MVDRLSPTEYPFSTFKHQINSYRLNYLDEGTGFPTLMLHGNPTWSYYFRSLVRELSGSFRCVVPDHIGFGLSDKPQNYPYLLSNHIDNCESLLNSMNIDKFDLIVHDWGGAIGMGVAVRNPDRVRKMVIMNSASFRSRRMPWQIAICRFPLLGTFAVRKLNLFLRAARYMGTAKHTGLPAGVWNGYLFPYGNYASRVGIDSFVKDIPMNKSHPSYNTILGIEGKLSSLASKPVLLLWGMRDFCFTPKFLSRWLDFFPDALTIKMENAGHFVLEDEPLKSALAIKNFLTERESDGF
ncbi:MAG: alpha/beta fold hydrolase [Candidatus Wallbacteria bacterium]|nr:alpha/beta fold hydrolase [Candidatus Wallbacteria bacterium]